MLDMENLIFGLFGMGLALGIFVYIVGPTLEAKHEPEDFNA